MIDYIVQAEQEAIRTKILNRLNYARAFWKPLHQRQDYWMQMYSLLDPVQQAKPLGSRKYVSNEPRTALDTAHSILTRNEMRWRVDEMGSEDEIGLERPKLGKIERTLSGVVYDIDEMFVSRGEMPFWKRVAMQALIRGWVWVKTHVTTEALQYRNSPLVAEVYDSRTVFPLFDQYGLNAVIIESVCNLGELVTMYPETYGHKELEDNYNPYTPALKIEYWSNDRGSQPGMMACLASVGTSPSTTWEMLMTSPPSDASQWLISPFYHGYPYDALPVQGVPVNGVSVKNKPAVMGMLEARLVEKADYLALASLSWRGPGSWVADTGRSILSAVEDQIPQYNELIATIFQHFSVGTYGTWVFKTPTGEIPAFQPNTDSKVALRLEESVERMEPQPISADAFRLIGLLQEERQKGTLSHILQAVVPFEGTGVLFQQMTNAALNALEPYHDGMRQLGIRVGTSLLKQMQLAAPILESFELVAPTRKESFFRIEFDPKTDLDQTRHYRPMPVLKPALPDDLTVRLQAARLALDPRRPMMSLYSVLETIIQMDDPAGEIDKIWEDIAQTDPVIVLEQIAMALERRGEPEMAARMRENEFKAQMIEDLQFRQMTGNIPGAPGRTPPGPGPETGAPTATQQRGEAGRGAEGRTTEGAAVMGALGERMSV